jgi:hypothetical protein
MNESTLTQLKILVERTVRPVRVSSSLKRKMREELLAHVSAVFEEEAAKLGNERVALERTAERFGNPADLTGQLQGSVPACDFLLRFLEGLAHRPGESALRRAVRYALITFVVWGGALLPAFVVQGRLREWPILFAGPVLVFGLTLLGVWMCQALCGPAGRSWPKAALVATASWLLIPGVTFGVLLIYSGDVRSSLADVLPTSPWYGAIPVFMAVWGSLTAAQKRNAEEWASLQIE